MAEKPVVAYKHKGIDIAVFKNIGTVKDENGNLNKRTFYNVSVIRSYMGKDNEWKKTGFFSVEEIPAVVDLLLKAKQDVEKL